MTVACGRREGIKKGMPVVWAGHLIGRISEVGVFTSRVQLVTDKEFKIGVVVVPKYLGEGTQTRGQVGVLEGNASGGCIVKWLYGGTDIRKGWFVITKGDPFIPLPRGLIVGEVENTSYRSNVEISVTPIINFSNLEYVIILKPKDADS
jgi:rod shape-determining protein MreC